MTIKPILQFHNSDSTRDLNTTQALIIDRAIFNGGALTLSGTSLQITVAPFVASGYDGMVAVSDAATTLSLPVNAISYIVLHLEYRSLTTPITSLLVVSEATWTTSISKEYFVTFAKVTVPAAVTSILPAYVDYSVGDWADKLGKTGWRAPVATSASLPTTGNRDGDIRIALDTLVVYVWNAAIPAATSAWVSLSSWKAPVANFAALAALPAVGNTLSDVRVVNDTQIAYAWDGAAWITLPMASLSLDGAYRGGVLADPSVGRVITLDGGAVETRSALATSYAHDVANAHFRADQTSDAVPSGGGFESVSYGRSGVAPASALFGLMDRRVLNFSGVTNIGDSEAATLIAPATITLTTGQFWDGASSHLIVLYDLVEVLSGVDTGLYVLSGLVGSDTCTVRNLDGTTPAFTGSVEAIRVCRPILGSFNRNGQAFPAFHSLQSVAVSGTPGQESALELLPGSTLGRFDTVNASPDGARYALKVKQKSSTGNVSTALAVDAQGQLQSYVKNAQLTTTQRTRSVNFGAPAFVVQQDQDAGTPLDAEVGFLARSNAGLLPGVGQWLGMTTVGSVRDDSTGTGLFTVTYSAALAPYNVHFTNTTATEAWINPTLTFVEIISATHAGVYLVNSRGSIFGGESGLVELVAIDGTVVDFSGMGAATARLLYAASLGGRNLNIGTSVIPGMPTDCRVTATIQAPKNVGGGVGGAALVLDCAPNGDNAWFIRCVLDISGNTKEVFSVASYGGVYGTSLDVTEGDITAEVGDITAFAGDFKAAAGEYLYTTPRPKTFQVPINGFTPPLSLNYLLAAIPTTEYYVDIATNNSYLIYPLDAYLREGMVITNFSVVVTPGFARTSVSLNNILVTLSKVDVDFGTPLAGTPTTIASKRDDEGVLIQKITLAAPIAESVVRDGSAGCSYFISIKFGNDCATPGKDDVLHGIQLHVTDLGPRN